MQAFFLQHQKRRDQWSRRFWCCKKGREKSDIDANAKLIYTAQGSFPFLHMVSFGPNRPSLYFASRVAGPPRKDLHHARHHGYV